MQSSEQTLKHVLQEMVATYRLQAKLHESRIQEYWQNMPLPIRKGTHKLSLRKRTLYITVTSAPLRQELTLNQEVLCKRINEHLKEDYVKKVVIC